MQPRIRMTSAVLAIVLLLGMAAAHSQASAPEGPGTTLFADGSVLDIELTGPFATIMADTEERKHQPMRLQVGERTLDVEIRVRGNSRLRVCQFPPLRVYFGDDSAGTLFEGIKSLKLVTHCFDSKRGDRNLADEYAAYRIFSVLTPYGYRTRPARVTYRDTGGEQGDSAVVRYAFFLESRPLLADRIGGERTNAQGIRLNELQPDQAATMYIFQYLIGNTDWSLVTADTDKHCCHNVDLVSRDGLIYAIPFDFDLSGIVNAPYAKPDPSLRIARVTTRRYRGYCIDAAYLSSALSRIQDRREAISYELRQIPIAEADQIEDILRYLDGFFRQAEKADKLVARFDNRCL